MLELTGMTKRFGGVVALDGVDFSLLSGEVHALLGENGAGKSTLINLIAGTYGWTEGSCRIDGQTISALTPQKSRDAGVAAVFQEFSLVPDLTVEENLFLGREIKGRLFLNRRAMRARAEERFRDIGFHVELDSKIETLTRAQKQMVEIAKGMLSDAKILILDEPTASLTDGEAEKLFAAIAGLKARGVGIIYVSHRMAEIRRLADRVTVLRGGRKIDTVAIAAASDAALIEMMVGQPVERLYPSISQRPAEIVLATRGISVSGTLSDASIVVRAGEIVGLAGLVGCGRSELCRAVFGLERVTSGEIELHGAVVRAPVPHSMLRAGLCYYPADRGAEGLALTRPGRENVTMAALDDPRLSQGGLLKSWRERRAIAAPLKTLGLRPMAPERAASSFSGGNQQKLVLARGLMRPVSVHIFDEPTVGIDVGAKSEVYRLMKSLVENGAAILLSSSELPELVHLAKRVYVMREGRIVAELKGDGITEATVLRHYFDAETGATEAA
ncbi:sugar ABC transporter ATP-binding protein [Mesorhizobium sp. M0051]|uniref:sugar ABC transporter ATP-binding protein n=1 Tax=Mesorhizobium sp. M0051 TaxID=2956862 RepID=UPI00333548CC